jgi:antitoxin HicB
MVKTASNEDVIARAEALMRNPYARLVVPEKDGSFRAEIVEFPGCIATSESAAGALASVENAAVSWVVAAIESGQEIPQPIELSNDYSGKFVLRIPKSLHKKASLTAEREGASLNQYITTALSIYLGECANVAKYDVANHMYLTSVKITPISPVYNSSNTFLAVPSSYTVGPPGSAGIPPAGAGSIISSGGAYTSGTTGDLSSMYNKRSLLEDQTRKQA